jgi:F0F1-type ATP synthase membrane subunit b/b'
MAKGKDQATSGKEKEKESEHRSSKKKHKQQKRKVDQEQDESDEWVEKEAPVETVSTASSTLDSLSNRAGAGC